MSAQPLRPRLPEGPRPARCTGPPCRVQRVPIVLIPIWGIDTPADSRGLSGAMSGAHGLLFFQTKNSSRKNYLLKAKSRTITVKISKRAPTCLRRRTAPVHLQSGLSGLVSSCRGKQWVFCVRPPARAHLVDPWPSACGLSACNGAAASPGGLCASGCG